MFGRGRFGRLCQSSAYKLPGLVRKSLALRQVHYILLVDTLCTALPVQCHGPFM